MRPIDKFILYIVHNWTNELKEAYSEGAIKKFIEKFREEADDLNINISDEILKKYIERFDTLKNSSKITEKDLNKWSIGQLIRLVTSSPGAEIENDKEDQTPDVVYNDGGITIWNGSKEGNCIKYGRGETWCITKTSFSTYRYNENRGYPTFYLAKNTNLPDSDKLSFVAIQVRDFDDEDIKYVYTNRKNSPYESSPMSFEGLLSEVPWLKNIPNIKNILKYIPLSSEDKINQIYEKKSITIKEWMKLPFNAKKQYLVIRKDKNPLFSDITIEAFIGKYIHKYPDIANFVSTSPNVIDPIVLLSNLDKFNNQDRKSITSNLQVPVDIKYLSTDEFPFDVKKILTLIKKWNIPSDERLYITKDGNTIVKLKFGDDIYVSLYQDEDNYPNIKLNKRTSKYLLDYPELDQLPFNKLLGLVSKEVIGKEFIDKVIKKAKEDPSSAIAIKTTEDGDILVDSNSLSAYKIKDNKISKLDINNEEVQNVFKGEEDNEHFQKSIIELIKRSIINKIPLSSSLDKESFLSMVKSTSPLLRQIVIDNIIYVVLVPDGDSNYEFFVKRKYSSGIESTLYMSADVYFTKSNWRTPNTSNENKKMKMGDWKSYFDFLRSQNINYSGEDVIRAIKITFYADEKRRFLQAKPPISPTDQYALVELNNIYVILNKRNPRDSYQLSDRTGKLIRANIPTSVANRLIGTNPNNPNNPPIPPITNPDVRRRGRPPGGGNVRAPQQPQARGTLAGTVAERMAEYNLSGGFLDLPSRIRIIRLTGQVHEVRTTSSRGASRRNNILGARGRVIRTFEIGSSSIYIIRLSNGNIVASINTQPGNGHFLVTRDRAYSLNSPTELAQTITARNLAEIRNFIIDEYIQRNPTHLDEIKSLIKKHIEENKK